MQHRERESTVNVIARDGCVYMNHASPDLRLGAVRKFTVRAKGLYQMLMPGFFFVGFLMTIVMAGAPGGREMAPGQVSLGDLKTLWILVAGPVHHTCESLHTLRAHSLTYIPV